MALAPPTGGGEAVIREWLRRLPVVDGVHRLPGADSRMEFARLYTEVRIQVLTDPAREPLDPNDLPPPGGTEPREDGATPEDTAVPATPPGGS